MASQVVGSLKSNPLETAAGLSFVVAGLLAVRFAAIGAGSGSITGIDGWLVMGAGQLACGLLVLWTAVS